MSVLAKAVTTSGNRKIGRVSTTLAAQQSCPSSCPFRNAGCYAERGPLGYFQVRPLNNHADEALATPIDVAIAEAEAIDEMDVVVGRPLRLHTVGDCASDEAAELVSAAAERYQERGGGQPWTYTHAWRDVERESWGEVSVLASCETPAEVLEARQRGYATALVVVSHESERRYEYDGIALIPCPAETRGRTCAECRLCFDDGRLRDSELTIGFAIHGDAATKKRAREALARKESHEELAVMAG